MTANKSDQQFLYTDMPINNSARLPMRQVTGVCLSYSNSKFYAHVHSHCANGSAERNFCAADKNSVRLIRRPTPKNIGQQSANTNS